MTQEREVYARELAGLYGINQSLPYPKLLDEFKKVLDAKRASLQKLYKMKAGVHKIQDAAGRNLSASIRQSIDSSSGNLGSAYVRDSSTLDRRSSRITTTDLIKQLNNDVQELTQDIGDLETSILYLKHSTTGTDTLKGSRKTPQDDENSTNDEVAELQRALDIELQVKSGAQRLIDTYKSGPRHILEEARRQYEDANNKIGFLRNQLIRVKQVKEESRRGPGLLGRRNPRQTKILLLETAWPVLRATTIITPPYQTPPVYLPFCLQPAPQQSTS
ncbi:unnamed protein product [Calicophoron daubneyi]|uniref:REM-1 domain-containing protein n=1 Tax=Calicophoron daubneyi TaxID=300641 RepID=A0AAV2TZ10_CALDB